MGRPWCVWQAVKWAVDQVRWAEAQARNGEILVDGSTWRAFERLALQGCFVDGSGTPYSQMHVPDLDADAASLFDRINLFDDQEIDVAANADALLGQYARYLPERNGIDVIRPSVTISVRTQLLLGHIPEWHPIVPLIPITEVRPNGRERITVRVCRIDGEQLAVQPGNPGIEARKGRRMGAACMLKLAVEPHTLLVARAAYTLWYEALQAIRCEMGVVKGRPLIDPDFDAIPWQSAETAYVDGLEAAE